MKQTTNLVLQAQGLTETILKAEWKRVKQEVAYPEVLMSSIPKPQESSSPTENDIDWPSR